MGQEHKANVRTTGSTDKRKARRIASFLLGAVTVALTATTAAATTRLVSTGGADVGDCSSSACLTIAYAVGQAVAGDTVSVAAGTYTENVTITKSLIMQGAQAGVDARGRVASETIVQPAVATTATFTVSFNGAITIDGFSFVGGSAATQGCVYNNVGPNDGMQILNNRFSGYSTAAIWLNRGGINMTIDRNVLDGSSIAAGAQAIFLNTQGFPGLHVTNNNIVNNTNRYGLFVDGNHNVGESATRAPLIDGNLFDNNLQGMNLGSRSLGTLGAPVLGTYAATISNNTFSNNAFDGVQGGLQHVLVTHNSFSANGRNGLGLTSFGNAGVDRGGQNSTITFNCFTGNGFTQTGAGLAFSATQAVGTISTNHAHNNTVRGNRVGATYTGTETIDAETNWWGCTTGANTGICDTSAVNVDASPFLSTPDAGAACGCSANAQCDDAVICTGVETCSAGACVAPPLPGNETACTDDGNVCTVDQCDGSGACEHVAGNSGTLCRTSAGVCDPAEFCDGLNTACPADAKSSSPCRVSAGVCDPAESCDGVNDDCPVDAKSSSECRASGGICDPAESCDGINDACPADAKSTSECRASGGVCDPAEVCDGINDACPADAKSTSQCRASGGVCDPAEVCDGVNDACPTDAKSTAVCRASAGVCDLVETCDGVNNACPSDAKSTALCRAAVDQCDAAENCDGAANTCPVDVLQPNGTTCNVADICQAGVCVGPTSLVLNRVSLRIDNSDARVDNGSVVIRRALVDDNDTAGPDKLEARLLTQTVTLEIHDNGGFSTTIALKGCKLVGTHGRIRCRDDSTRTRATFRPIPGPLVYRVAMSRRRINVAETGMATASGPIAAVLHQGTVDRSDDLPANRCIARSAALLVCNDP